VDLGLIAIVKRSPAYRLIRPRLADISPSDAWSEDGIAFVVFDLHSSMPTSSDRPPWVPQVLFALSISSGDLKAARVVDDIGGDGEAPFIDLLDHSRA
jgi:hypothetical protein